MFCPGGGSSGWLLLEDDRECLGAYFVPGRGPRDHAAHRGADDVRRVEVQVVEQRGGVVGDVLQRVDGRAAKARYERFIRGAAGAGVSAGHLGGQAYVAVVVADDAQALIDELRRSPCATTTIARRDP